MAVGGAKTAMTHQNDAVGRRILSPALKALIYGLLTAIALAWGIRYFEFTQTHRPPDFIPFYLGGKVAASGHIAEIYQKEAYAPYIAEIFKQGAAMTYGNYYFIRPVFQVLLYVPFSWLPYATASTLDVLINFFLLGILVWKLPDWFAAPDSWRLFIRVGLALFYPFHWAIMAGQDTLLLTLIISYAWRLAGKGKPVPAGLLLALGVYKPHFMWGLPLLMLVQKKTRMLAAFLGLSACLAAFSLVTVGPAGLRAWVSLLQDPSSDIVPSIMGNVRGLALHSGPAAGVLAATLVLVCFGVILWKGQPSQQLGAALLAPILLSPHTYWQDYALASILALASLHPVTLLVMLLPWPGFYPTPDELPIIFVSIGWLAVVATRLLLALKGPARGTASTQAAFALTAKSNP